MKGLRKKGIGMALLFMCLMLVQLVHPISAQAATTTVRLKVTSGKDITEQLQDALDLAEDNPGKAYKIVIPAGKYKISDTLKIHSNTCLSMKGVTLTRTKNLTMLRFGKLRVLQEVGGYSRYSGFKNISIEGGTWDGAGKTGAIVRGAHAQNLKFTSVVFTNVKNSHHVELAACATVQFSKCTFSNFSGNFASKTNYEALQLDIMHNEEHFNGFAKYDDTPCKNITISNCTFQKLQRGVGSHSAVAGSYFTGINITNNTFKDIRGYAIIATNYRNSKINNNTIKDCGSGIMFRTMVQSRDTFYTPLSGSVKVQKNANSQICNNTIQVNNKKYTNVCYGISLYGENVTKKAGEIPKGDFRLSGMTVKNNTINLNCKGYGIWLQGADKNKIVSNKITCAVKSGSTSGNGDGIRLQGSTGNTLQSNQITNTVTTGAASEMCGISVLEKSNSTILKANVIKGASKDGIAIKNSTKATVTSNKISKSGRYGLNVTNNSTATAKGNKVTGSKKKDVSLTSGAKINGKKTVKTI